MQVSYQTVQRPQPTNSSLGSILEGIHRFGFRRFKAFAFYPFLPAWCRIYSYLKEH